MQKGGPWQLGLMVILVGLALVWPEMRSTVSPPSCGDLAHEERSERDARSSTLLVMAESSINPCKYCAFCHHCKLCDEQCPCSHVKECQYCKYCPYCRLCSACDTFCSGDGIIESVSSLVQRVMTFMGLSAEPNWGEIEKDVEKLSPRFKGKPKKAEEKKEEKKQEKTTPTPKDEL